MYAYDTADRLTAKTNNGVLRTFGYDVTDQLTQDGTATFSYDANGNRTNPGYVVGVGNQVSTDGVWTYTYDAAGALSGKSDGAGNAWSYTYDNAWHLLSPTYTPFGGSATQRVTYAYDVFGNTIRRDYWNVTTTVTTKSAVDGWDTAKPSPLANEGFDVWGELNGSNALTTRRLYGSDLDDAVARMTRGTVNWYGKDYQHSVRQILDNSGNIIATTTYAAYGGIIAGSVTDSVGFTGGTFDAVTQLVNLGDRWLDTTTGTWLSQDRMGFGAGTPNLREYAANGPTNGIDPSGMADPRVVSPLSPLQIQQDPNAFGALGGGRC